MFNKNRYVNIIYILCFILSFGLEVSCNNINLNRYKRAIGNVRYLTDGSIDLQCFVPPKEKSDVASYFWILESSKYSKIEEQDIIDYEIYDKGENYGDLKILEPQVNTYHCNASLKNGDPYERRSYSLVQSIKPSKAIVETQRKIVGEEVTLPEGEHTFNCKALNGVPKPNISLMLHGATLKTINNTETIEMKLNLDQSMNGRKLYCKIDHLIVKDDSSVKLDILFKPVLFIDVNEICKKPEIDQNYSLHFNFRANPRASDVSWSYSNDCHESQGLDNFEIRYSISIPKLVPGTVDRYEATIIISPLEKEDRKRCFFLTVSNTEGQLQLQREIVEKCKYPQGLPVPHGIGIIGIAILAVLAVLLPSCLIAGLLYWKKVQKRGNT